MQTIRDVLVPVLVLAPGLELVPGLVREESIEWHAPCFGEWSVAFDIQLAHEKLLAVQQAIQLLQQAQRMRIVDARLREQLLRATKSVCLNLAEAVGRFSHADRKRVYAIANHLHDHPHEPIIGHQNEDTHDPDGSEQV